MIYLPSDGGGAVSFISPSFRLEKNSELSLESIMAFSSCKLLKSHLRDEILKAYTRVKPGLFVCIDPSKAKVKTLVLDGLEFSKNQPSWVLLSLRLESSAADDCKFRKIFYICTFKISGIICGVKFY